MSIKQITSDTPAPTIGIPTEQEAIVATALAISLTLAPELPPTAATAVVADVIARAQKPLRPKRKRPVRPGTAETKLNPRKCFTTAGCLLKDDVYAVWFCQGLSQERRDSFIRTSLCSPVVFEAKLINEGLTEQSDRHEASAIFHRVIFDVFKSAKPELLLNSK